MIWTPRHHEHNPATHSTSRNHCLRIYPLRALSYTQWREGGLVTFEILRNVPLVRMKEGPSACLWLCALETKSSSAFLSRIEGREWLLVTMDPETQSSLPLGDGGGRLLTMLWDLLTRRKPSGGVWLKNWRRVRMNFAWPSTLVLCYVSFSCLLLYRVGVSILGYSLVEVFAWSCWSCWCVDSVLVFCVLDCTASGPLCYFMLRFICSSASWWIFSCFVFLLLV